MKNFLNESRVLQVVGRNAGTSATSVLSDPIDTTGFDSLALIVAISSTAPASGGLTATFQHGETTTGFVNTTTAITTNGPAAQKVGVIDIQKLTKRWARLRINPDHTDAIGIGSVIGVLYNAGQNPVVQSAIPTGMSVAKVTPTS